MNNENGRFGFPLVEAQYTICSDVYGHALNVPQNEHSDDVFLDAVKAGYDNGCHEGHGVPLLKMVVPILKHWLAVERLFSVTEKSTGNLCLIPFIRYFIFIYKSIT